MKIHRSWSASYFVNDVWQEHLSVIPSKSILGYHGGDIKTDCLGNRIDEETNITSVLEYGCCVGGSTTFGHFCDFSDSYPKHLEKILHFPIINLGLAKADLWLGFQNLLDFLRLQDKYPKFVIFVDGINQNSAITQTINGDKEFKLMSPLTPQTKLLLKEFRESNKGFKNIENWFRFIFGNKYQNYKNAIAYKKREIPSDTLFVKDEASIYIQSKDLISKVLTDLGIKSYFCLQPSLWDVWDTTPSYQGVYLNNLYSLILSTTSNVYDLRTNVREFLQPEHFIDWAHLNPQGNRQLARLIQKNVLDLKI